jgi:membrane-associated phospholipid phosphatase
VSTRIRAFALLAASAAVGALSSTPRGREVDRGVFRALNAHRSGAADAAFKGVTELGSIWAQLGAATVVAASGRRQAAGRALAAAATTWLIGQALKQLWRRPRPWLRFADEEEGWHRLLILKPRGTSWPSSHPAVLFTFVTVVERELRLDRPVRAGLTGLAGAVAASRVALGVHFPSDVASGLLLGRAVGLLWSEQTSGGR